MLFVLNFHGLGWPPRDLTSGEQQCWIDVSFFEAILDLIRGRNDVQLTFDDSNESDYTVAFPALKARKMVAKFFVVAGRIDQTGYLSKSQLQSLVSEGMTIGNHGMSHRPWPGLNATALNEELVGAKDSLEKIIGMPVTQAACPFGSYSRRVLRVLRNLGYDSIYTSDGGPAFAGSWIQPRNTILRTYDMPRIERIVTCAPHGFRETWRNIKLTLKQLR